MRCLPKPLGPFDVAFGDLEIESDAIKWNRDMVKLMTPDCNQSTAAAAAAASGNGRQPSTSLTRIYYPTDHRPSKWSVGDCNSRRWIPSILYTWGYLRQTWQTDRSSSIATVGAYLVTSLIHLTAIPITIAAQLAPPVSSAMESEEEHDGIAKKFPVVVFSHGMNSMRTTYSTFCSDLASYGYVVFALEHRDGSACASSYITKEGKYEWLANPHNGSIQAAPMKARNVQLRHRVTEVKHVIDLIKSLNDGDVSTSANLRSDRTKMNPSWLRGRLDLDKIAIAGHSFGAATAVCAAGLDERLKCCVAMDTWWDPLAKEDYERHAGEVPLICVDSEKFSWPNLRRLREEFLKQRGYSNGKDTRAGVGTGDGDEECRRRLITKAVIIKGSAHLNQSDFPLIWPWIMKKAGMSGSLDVNVNRAINSKICVNFLNQHLHIAGSTWRPEVSISENEKAHVDVRQSMHFGHEAS